METLEAVLRAKTLEQIETLEKRVDSDLRAHAEVEKKKKELEQLRAKVLELSERRDQLQQKLKHFPTDSLRSSVLRDTTVDGVHITSLPQHQQDEILTQAVQEEERRKLDYLLVAHRCAGTTARILRKGRVRIRFETMYRGEYFEPFYLELEFTGKQIKYRWHTLPAFVPLTELIDKYNNSAILFTAVLSILHSYVSAFVRRRQQTIELSSKYPEHLAEEIASFYAYNFIQLVLNVPVNDEPSQLVIHLHYKQLQSDLPTKVRCSDPGNLPVDRGRIKQAFLTLPIAEAFQNLFLDQNIEQG